ncbi:MXAN_6640 family putative metalloprotease [Nocardioides sp. MH1]|uniref:MXAN_6640 family putative metalloprotease n=1 Tax=Nocardioides sp. MH1 TaxID=3242490 RepID=UPI00351FF542
MKWALSLAVSLTVVLVPVAQGQTAAAGAGSGDGHRVAAGRAGTTPAGATAIYRANRPEGPRDSCTRQLCVHWVTGGKNAPDRHDGNHNKVPDFVDKVRTTAQSILTRYRKAGYLSPQKDPGVDDGKRLDIYLRNVGARGSRCLTDNPALEHPQLGARLHTWAYCVLDNNFSHREFPIGKPVANLQLTAAHELFHAVEMAYDAVADGWLWESSATWAADQLYPSAAQRRQYLKASPMTSPTTSLDQYDDELHGYPAGVAVFWRFLSERYPAAQGRMPTLVRDVWRRTNVRSSTPDTSLEALVDVIEERGGTGALTSAFADFADANRHPRDSYVRGASYPVPAAPTFDRTLSAAAPGPIGGSRTLDHLSSFTVRFTPGAVPAGTTWRLNLTVSLPSPVTKPRAVITQYLQDGTTKVVRTVATSGAVPSLAFDTATYKYVEVTLVDAGDRTERCDTDDTSPYFSCHGHPLDDNVTAGVTGTLTQVVAPPRH